MKVIIASKKKTQLILDIHRSRTRKLNQQKARNPLKEANGSKVLPADRHKKCHIETESATPNPTTLTFLYATVEQNQQIGLSKERSKGRATRGFLNPKLLVMPERKKLGEREKRGNL